MGYFYRLLLDKGCFVLQPFTCYMLWSCKNVHYFLHYPLDPWPPFSYLQGPSFILYYTTLYASTSHSFFPLSQLPAACIQYKVAASVTSRTPPPNHTLLVLPPIPLFPPFSMRAEMLPALGIQWQLLLPAALAQLEPHTIHMLIKESYVILLPLIYCLFIAAGLFC